MVRTVPAVRHPVEHADGLVSSPVGPGTRPECGRGQGGRNGAVGRAHIARGDGALQGHSGRPGRVRLLEGDRAL